MTEQYGDNGTMNTRISHYRLAGSQYQTELRDSHLHMFSAIAQLPAEYATMKWDLGRTDPRRYHIMGRYPDVAPHLSLLGARPFDVLEPLRVVEREVWAAHDHRASLPSLECAQIEETHKQAVADEAQLKLARMVTPLTLQDAYAQLADHENAIRQLRRVIGRMLSQHQRQAAA